MAVTKGGATILQQVVRLARTVKKHTAAGAMAYGLSLPGAAALTLLADIVVTLDTLGAFEGQGGAKGISMDMTLDARQQQLLGMDITAIKEYLRAE